MLSFGTRAGLTRIEHPYKLFYGARARIVGDEPFFRHTPSGPTSNEWPMYCGHRVDILCGLLSTALKCVSLLAAHISDFASLQVDRHCGCIVAWSGKYAMHIRRQPLQVSCLLLPGSCLYSFEADTVLSPIHHLAIMGQPFRSDFSRMPLHELKSLAGEGFAAPCISAAVAAFALNPWGPWWCPSEAAGSG